MKRLSLFLLALIAVELVLWYAPDPLPVPSELPAVDLGLLGDQVAIDTLHQLQQQVDLRDPDHWKQLGEYYLTYGYYPQAELCFRVARQMNPDDDSLLIPAAISLDRMGYKEQAIERYRMAIERGAPGADSYAIRIAHCLLADGREPEAEQVLKDMNQAADAKLLRIRMLYRDGRVDEAKAVTKELLQEYPQGIEPRSLDCWIVEERGDHPAAYELQGRALRAESNIAINRLVRAEDMQRRREHSNWLFHQRSIELETRGLIEEARQACEQAVQSMWEEDMVVSYALFEIHLGQADSAIEMLEDAIDRVGGSSALLDALGDAWERKGDLNSAISVWLRAVDMRGTPAIHEKLSRSFTATGDSAKAGWHQGMLQYELGKEAWLDNRIAQARDYFAAATKLAPDHGHSWYYLAETRRLSGDREGAKAAYRRCLAINPNHGRAIEALDRLEAASVVPKH